MCDLIEKHGRTSLPAIAVTGYADDEHRQRAIDEGFQMYLAKPIEREELIQVVINLVSADQAYSRFFRRWFWSRFLFSCVLIVRFIHIRDFDFRAEFLIVAKAYVVAALKGLRAHTGG